MPSLISKLKAQQNQHTLIDSKNTPQSIIEIHQLDNYRWIYTGGNSIQSTVDLSQPEKLIQPYQQVMLCALAIKPTPPKNILNLGFGGGAFERFFAHHYNDIAITSIDNNADIVSMAKQHLPQANNNKVIIEQAHHFLNQDLETFELILVDLFDGENHANCLNEASFFLQLHRAMSDDAIVSINLSPASERQLINITSIAHQTFAFNMLSKVEGYGNIILIASKTSLAIDNPCVDIAGIELQSLLAGFKQIG